MHSHPGTISYWINRWEAERTIARRPGTGHHFATTDDEEANIYVRACNFPYETPEQIRNTLGLECSVDTVRLVLKSLGIKRYRAYQTERLTEAHMQSRLNFANEHQHWNANNWDEVIFTDEKVFLSYPNGVVHVSRPRGHRNNSQFFADKKVSGRFSVNCHLWMTGNGLGGLNRIHGLRHGTYIELLENYVLPQIRESFPDQIMIFMHDLAPAHTHQENRLFLNNQEDLAHINWPPKGADLNPVEIIWAIMQQIVSRLIRIIGRPENADSLWQYVLVAYNFQRDQDLTRKLVNGMPNKIQLVRQRNGNWIQI